VEEMNRRGVAAVLAADSDLQRGTRLASALDADADEIADALHVDRRERILFEDLLLLIDLQELPDVVAREPERELREIVRAEREELGVLGDLIGDDRAARHLDHGADEVLDANALLLHRLAGDAVDNGFLIAQLLHDPDERNHDLWDDLDPFLIEL